MGRFFSFAAVRLLVGTREYRCHGPLGLGTVAQPYRSQGREKKKPRKREHAIRGKVGKLLSASPPAASTT